MTQRFLAALSFVVASVATVLLALQLVSYRDEHTATVPLDKVSALEGFAYQVNLTRFVDPILARQSDRGAPLRSSLRLYEDNQIIGPTHAEHGRIRELGGGRSSHWGDWLVFSTTDNTDPRANGRSYFVAYRLGPPVLLLLALPLMAVVTTLFAVFAITPGRPTALGYAATLPSVCTVLAIGFFLALSTGVVRMTLSVAVQPLQPAGGYAHTMEWSRLVKPFIVAPAAGSPLAEKVRMRIDGVSTRAGSRSDREVADGGNGRFRYGDSYLTVSAPNGETQRPQSLELSMPVVMPASVLAVLILLTAAFLPTTLLVTQAPKMTARRAGGAIAAPLLVVGGGVLALNVSGVLVSMRPKNIERLGDYGPLDVTLSLAEAKRLIGGEASDRDRYIYDVYQAVEGSMAHYWWERGAERYGLQVPLTENWFLNMLPVVTGDPYAYRYSFADPYKSLERGLGMCGQVSVTFAAFLDRAQIPAQRLSLDLHTVATAQMSDGAWRIFDPDYGVVVPHSPAEVQANSSLIEEPYRARLLELGWEEADVTTLVTSLKSSYANEHAFYEPDAEMPEYFPRTEARAYRLKWTLPMGLFLLGCAIFAAGRAPREAWARVLGRSGRATKASA